MMVARSLYGTGRVNLAQGAVITVRSAGVALMLGRFGLVAAGAWVALGAIVKQY